MLREGSGGCLNMAGFANEDQDLRVVTFAAMFRISAPVSDGLSRPLHSD